MEEEEAKEEERWWKATITVTLLIGYLNFFFQT